MGGSADAASKRAPMWEWGGWLELLKSNPDPRLLGVVVHSRPSGVKGLASEIIQGEVLVHEKVNYVASGRRNIKMLVNVYALS